MKHIRSKLVGSARCADRTPQRSVPALKAHAVFKKNPFSLYVCAAAEKKIAYFRRVIAAIVGGIESKKDASARRQVML